jgi:hypothetical protein
VRACEREGVSGVCVRERDAYGVCVRARARTRVIRDAYGVCVRARASELMTVCVRACACV